jgi:uncharacterized membrane protein
VNCDSISIRPAVNFAWRTFKRRCGLFAAILVTVCVGWVALEVVVIAGQRVGIVLWVAAHLAFLIFFAGIQVGFLRICLASYDGGEPTVADTFAPLRTSLKFLAGQVAYLLMVVMGAALLIVPGVYLGVRYFLFAFYMAGDEPDLADGFEQSATLTSGRMICLSSIFFALFLLNAIGACLLGLGLFVTVPVSVLVMTAVYRQLSTGRQVKGIGRA